MANGGIFRFDIKTRLASGNLSTFYITMRDLLFDDHPELLPLIGELFVQKLQDLTGFRKHQVVVGIPYTACILATAAVIMGVLKGLPISGIIQRKELKNYGLGDKKLVVGTPKPDREYNLLDDVLTTAFTKKKYIDIAEREGFVIRRIIVFLDRQQGGEKTLREEGYEVYSIYKSLEVFSFLKDENLITLKQYKEALKEISN